MPNFYARGDIDVILPTTPIAAIVEGVPCFSSVTSLSHLFLQTAVRGIARGLQTVFSIRFSRFLQSISLFVQVNHTFDMAAWFILGSATSLHLMYYTKVLCFNYRVTQVYREVRHVQHLQPVCGEQRQPST